MPLERDEGEYAYAGQLLMQGIPPYDLAWNMKLPGTYFGYALGMAAFGQTVAGVHETLMVVNALTIIFVFLLARKLYGSVAGIFACATFGILSVSPAVMGMAAHANHFVILCAVPATLLLWQAEESNETRTFFLSGLFYGLAFLMKQQGIGFCAFAFFMVIWNGILHGTFKSMVRKFFVLAIGMLLPFGFLCLYLQFAGIFSKFWFWTFTYAWSYATELTPRDGLAKLLDYVHKKWPIYVAFVGLIILSLPFIARDRALRKPIIFGILFLLFSALGTAIDFNFREHYFILFLPALAIMVGLAVAAMQEEGGRMLKVLSPLVCLLILGWCVYMQRQFFFQIPARNISQIIYSGDTPFAGVDDVGDYIRTHSRTSETVAVVGSEPEVYFYAQRHSATGYMYMYPMMEPQPFASQMQKEMIHEIETAKPDFLVLAINADSWNVRSNSDQTVFKWFPTYANASYDRVAALYRVADMTKLVQGDELKSNSTNGAGDVVVYKRRASLE
jgi:hypothetical protein